MNPTSNDWPTDAPGWLVGASIVATVLAAFIIAWVVGRMRRYHHDRTESSLGRELR